MEEGLVAPEVVAALVLVAHSSAGVDSCAVGHGCAVHMENKQMEARKLASAPMLTEMMVENSATTEAGYPATRAMYVRRDDSRLCGHHEYQVRQV